MTEKAIAYVLSDDWVAIVLELLETAINESDKLTSEYCQDESIADSAETFDAVTQDHTQRLQNMQLLHLYLDTTRG